MDKPILTPREAWVMLGTLGAPLLLALLAIAAVIVGR